MIYERKLRIEKYETDVKKREMDRLKAFEESRDLAN